MAKESDMEVAKSRVGQMCSNCAKQEIDGSCGWLWVSPEEQLRRAEYGLCKDASVVDVNFNELRASLVKLRFPKTGWITWIKK